MCNWHLFKAIELKWRLTSLKETVKTGTCCGPKGKFLFFQFSRLQHILVIGLKGIWAKQKGCTFLLLTTLLIMAIGVILIAQKKDILCLPTESWPFLLLLWEQGSSTLISYHKVHWQKISMFITLYKYHAIRECKRVWTYTINTPLTKWNQNFHIWEPKVRHSS